MPFGTIGAERVKTLVCLEKKDFLSGPDRQLTVPFKSVELAPLVTQVSQGENGDRSVSPFSPRFVSVLKGAGSTSSLGPGAK